MCKFNNLEIKKEDGTLSYVLCLSINSQKIYNITEMASYLKIEKSLLIQLLEKCNAKVSTIVDLAFCESKKNAEAIEDILNPYLVMYNITQ